VDWQMLQAVAESLGTVGVIVSLLYLAAQVRMGARATQRATAHEFNSASREFYALLSANAEAAAIWQRGLVDPESLTPAESMRLSALLLHVTTLWEEQFYAVGDKDVPVWAKHGQTMARPEIAALPGFERWFAERGDWFSPPFRKALEEDIQKASARRASFYVPKENREQ
jgi:hypothetical protein